MSQKQQDTMLMTLDLPDSLKDRQIQKLLSIAENDVIWYKKLQESVNWSDEAIMPMKWPMEKEILGKIIKWDRSSHTASMIQRYCKIYLKLSPDVIWPMDSKYWPKTLKLEKIVFERITQSKVENKESLRSPQELKKILESNKGFIELIWVKDGAKLFSPELIFALENPNEQVRFWNAMSAFKEYIKTPEWKVILENSFRQYRRISYLDQFELQQWLDNTVNDDNKKILEQSFELQEKMIKDIDKEELKLKDEIMQAKLKHSTTRDSVVWCHDNMPLQRDLNKLQERYDKFLKWKIDSMSKEYLKALWSIVPVSDILKQWKYEEFKIWNISIDLNLGDLSENINSWKLNSPEKIRSYIDANSDKLIVKTYWEHIKKWLSQQWDNMKKDPQKFLVNASAVFCWWVWATLLATETWWIWLLQAWFAFTAIHDAVKAAWYATLAYSRWENVMEAVNDAVWYKTWMSLSEYYKNKAIELWSNTALFWIFRIVEKWLSISTWAWVSFKDVEKYLSHSFKDAVKHEYLKDVIKFWSIKTWITLSKIWMEASAFTLYQVEVTPYEKAIIDTMWNPKDWERYLATARNETKEMSKPENLSQLLMYNSLFVTTLRASFKCSEYLTKFSSREKIHKMYDLMKESDNLENQRQSEISNIERKWYRIMSNPGGMLVITDAKWKPANLLSEDFAKLRKINIDLKNKEPEFQKLIYTIYKPVIDNLKNESDPSKKKAIDVDTNSNPKETTRTERDDPNNWRVWSWLAPREFWLGNMVLEDFMKWMSGKEKTENIGWDVQVSPEFANLLRKMYNVKDRTGLKIEIDRTVKSEIKILKDTIAEAKAKKLDHIELNIDWKTRKVKITEIETIMKGLENKMKKDFRNALKLGVKWKEMPDKYWDPKWVKEMIRVFVENMSPELFIEMKGDPSQRKPKTEDIYK